MNIKVTVETFREPGQECLVVGCCVALGALGNILVLGVMTGRAVNLGMLALGSFPFVVNLLVAGSAGYGRRIFRIRDQFRIVDWMALGAGAELLARVVRFVTHGAIRDKAVRSMALVAGNLGVFAQVFSQLLLRASVTLTACSRQPGIGHHFLRCMRV